MRTRFLPMIALCVGATLLAVASDRSAADGEGFVRLTPGEIRWQDIPGGHGARMATIAGDPARPGIYVQRVRFPPHVMDRPHWHPGNRYVTVLEGTWFTGTGATFDPAKAVPLKPGSYMFHPARALHWDGSNSDEAVIVQVVGLGPLETTQDDPGKPFWVQLDH
ncbi:MAG TPA: cupin domain-containing protein [Steroidobacteraceae bacterium]|nr:cupin domain-containing protein [Steroidobacteraceae bacterium]